VLNRKVTRLLPCFLLAALALGQAAQTDHHTCAGSLHHAGIDGANPAVHSAPADTESVAPVCPGCAHASQCGAPHTVTAPAALPSDGETCSAGNPNPKVSPLLAEALLPRPPPSHA
jgi:hypothetical protein